MGPGTYRGPLALKKLYNKRKGVKGASPRAAPPAAPPVQVWIFPFVWILYNTAGGAGFTWAIRRDAKRVLQNGHHRGESGPSQSEGSNTQEVNRCSALLHLLLHFFPSFRRTRWTPVPGRSRTDTVPVEKHRNLTSNLCVHAFIFWLLCLLSFANIRTNERTRIS